MKGAIVLVSAVLLVAGQAGAQVRSLRIGVDARTWSFSDKTTGESQGASQFSYPLNLQVALRSDLDLQVEYAGATSALDPLGERTERVSGFADLDTHLLYRTADERLLLTAGFNLPTGKTGLTDDELDVAALIGHRLMGFRTRRIGRGFDVSASATYGGSVARGVTASLGAGFVKRGDYEMRGDDFGPADEASVSVGMGVRNRTGSVRTSWEATARFFGIDAIGGSDVYEQGDRLELQGAVLFRGRPYSAGLRALLAFQGDDRTFTGTDPAALAAIDFPPGTGFFLRAVPERLVGGGTAGLDLQWNHYSGSQVPQPAADLREDGDVFLMGPAVRFPWGTTDVLARVLYTVGVIRGRPGETDLDVSGAVLAVDLAWRPRGEARGGRR